MQYDHMEYILYIEALQLQTPDKYHQPALNLQFNICTTSKGNGKGSMFSVVPFSLHSRATTGLLLSRR